MDPLKSLGKTKTSIVNEAFMTLTYNRVISKNVEILYNNKIINGDSLILKMNVNYAAATYKEK